MNSQLFLEGRDKVRDGQDEGEIMVDCIVELRRGREERGGEGRVRDWGGQGQFPRSLQEDLMQFFIINGKLEPLEKQSKGKKDEGR